MKQSLSALLCALSIITLSTVSIAGVTTRVTPRVGLVESPDAKNVALLVGVTYGLPGIDLDLKNVKEIASHPGYRFDTHELWEDEGVVANVSKNLTDLAASIPKGGTLFFYFSGHGSPEGVLMNDRLMTIAEIRAAIEKGRKNKGPLDRLVMMFDSCYSGALLDPLRKSMLVSTKPLNADSFTENLVSELKAGNRAEQYWKKLFVFASSRADETSAAGADGSAFTVSLRKAFDESVLAKSTVADFVAKTQKYTAEYHHPVARLVPVTMGTEALVP